MLLNIQQSCVINGDNNTPYFHLEKVTRKGDPVSAYLFNLALEVDFVLEIFKHDFLYTAYADDSIFFLRSVPSVKELNNSFSQFYNISGLKANIEKCEIAGKGSLKRVKEAVYQSVKKMQQVLRLWNSRTLTLGRGRIIIFKTLAISEIVYFAFILPCYLILP